MMRHPNILGHQLRARVCAAARVQCYFFLLFGVVSVSARTLVCSVFSIRILLVAWRQA